jgi:hypothetical protein
MRNKASSGSGGTLCEGLDKTRARWDHFVRGIAFGGVSSRCMHQIKALLNKPFPGITGTRQLVWAAAGFGAFVFLFLYVFKPFGLDSIPQPLLLVTLGYGLITSVGMLLISFIVKPLFPAYYDDQGWTTGKEVAHTMLNIVVIALGNFLYSAALGFVPVNATVLAVFTGFTMAVGIMPATIHVLIRQNNLQKKYAAGSSALNASIDKEPLTQADEKSLTLLDDEGREVVRCASSELLVIESMDNYVKIYYETGEGVKSVIARGALNRIEVDLAPYRAFFRTHRSYLVNLQRVTKIDGNARGYTLWIGGVDKAIPVARRRTEAFDEALSSR